MQTKAKFRLICAKITAAEEKTAQEIADNARVPVKSHLDVISATRVLNILPTLAVVDETALTPNELKAYELALLEPIVAGKTKLCSLCGQEIDDTATMCVFCGTEIGKLNETALLEEIPVPLIPKVVEMNMLVPILKLSKPSTIAFQESRPKPPVPYDGAITAEPEKVVQFQQNEEQSELELAAFESFVAAESARVARDVSGVEKNMDYMSEKELYQLLAESTARLKPLLNMAREQHIDASECKNLLSNVVIYSRNKETKKAVTAMHLGEKSIRSAIKLKFLRNISLLENEVAEFRSAWVGVARAQKLIISAKDFLKAGEYLEVPMNLDDAGNGLEHFRMAFSQ